jgi:hypothetical protein
MNLLPWKLCSRAVFKQIFWILKKKDKTSDQDYELGKIAAAVSGFQPSRFNGSPSM